jgi:hypothetical protein
MDPFSTHQASLVAAMLATRGPILELGGGWYSTPLVSAFSVAQQRVACTVETNDPFLQLLKAYSSPLHEFHHLAGYDFEPSGKFSPRPGTTRAEYIGIQQRFLDELCARHREPWSIVFIDQRPGFLRTPSLEHFANRAEFLVVHDTEHPAYEYEPLLSQFRFRCDVRLHVPATTIVSNVRPCDSFTPQGLTHTIPAQA